MDNAQNNYQNDLFAEANTNERKLEWKSTENSIAHHGIAFDIFNRGVVIIGKSGVGKSELGLELIDRGHRLICDDLVSGQLVNQQIVLSAPQSFGIGFMEIRGIGFIDVNRFYGIQALCQEQKLALIIELVDNSMLDLVNQDRLLQLMGTVEVLGVKIPLYKLPIGANRNLPVLVELIVKYAIAREHGYDSHQFFIDEQSRMIEQGSD
jgi:HPr kinase/phosphorylase